MSLSGDPSIDAALRDVNDSVRYTMTLPENGYVQGVERATAGLKGLGFEEAVVKNFWKRNEVNGRYRGINTTWRDPATGQVFEFQFHTPESLFAKEIAHPWYEKLCTPGFTDAEINAAKHISQLIFGDVSFPTGAIRVPEFG